MIVDIVVDWIMLPFPTFSTRMLHKTIETSLIFPEQFTKLYISKFPGQFPPTNMISVLPILPILCPSSYIKGGQSTSP